MPVPQWLKPKKNNDLASSGIWQNRRTLLIASIISSAAFQYGLDFGLIGGFQSMPGFLAVFGFRDPAITIGWNIDPTVQQLIASLLTLGAFIGSLFAGPMAKFLDRRSCLAVASLMCCVGVAIQIATTSLGALYFARFFLGVANGILMVQTQLFLQEVSPPHLRGTMFAFFQFWVSFGSLISSIIDNYTARIMSRLAYQIPLCLLFVVPVLLFTTLPFIPDSPRWAISHGREEKALKYLKKLRGPWYPETLIAEEFGEIKAAWEAEKEMSAHKFDIFELFRGVNRRRTLAALGACMLHPASGSMFLLSYGTYFFTIAGSHKPFENHIVLTVIGLISVICMGHVIRLLPRRKIILIAVAVQGLTMLIIGIIYTAAPTDPKALNTLIAMVSIYLFFYAGWSGPTNWVLTGEIPSQRLRSYTLGLGAALGFLFGWVAAYTAPYFINTRELNWGPKYGYVWFGSNAIAWIWAFFFLPETKDRTLEEIDELFNSGIPARKFGSYVCVASQKMREEGIKQVDISTDDRLSSDLSEKDGMDEKSDV